MEIILRVSPPSGPPFTFRHAGPTVWIGRDPWCALQLQGAGAQAVSGRHACIELTRAGAYLLDPGSSNGTWLNDRFVTSRIPVNEGDRVRLGATGPAVEITRLTLSPEAADADPAPVLQAKDRPASAPEAFPPSERPSPAVAPSPPTVMRQTLAGLERRQRRALLTAGVVAACLICTLGFALWRYGRHLARVEEQVGVVHHENRAQGEWLEQQRQKIESQQSKVSAIAQQADHLAATLSTTEGQVASLSAAQKRLLHQHEDALAALQRGFEERLQKTLNEPTDRFRSEIPAGTPLADALKLLEQSYRVSIEIDVQGFRDIGLGDIGARRTTAPLKPPSGQSLRGILLQLLHQIEPSDVAQMGKSRRREIVLCCPPRAMATRTAAWKRPQQEPREVAGPNGKSKRSGTATC